MSNDLAFISPEAGADGGVRLLLVGPMPPPINGQSVVMSHIASKLLPKFPLMRVCDGSAGDSKAWLRPAVKVARSAIAMWSIATADVVYIAVKAGKGMWLTTAAAGLARLLGANIFLHHHSYAYVRERKLRMVALVRSAGPGAHHIVLSQSMSTQLRRVMPEIQGLLVVGNAGLIDKNLLGLPLKADFSDLVLGHLSELTPAKGVGEVVELAIALNRSGVRARLIVGGPDAKGVPRRQLDRAASELGEMFEYRGLLTGEAKLRFFDDISHFIFPSSYVNEAVPLVLYEAMAAGAVCVATRQGSIPEQLDGSPSVLAENSDTFVVEALPALSDAVVSNSVSAECRRAYTIALEESEKQLSALSKLLAGPSHCKES